MYGFMHDCKFVIDVKICNNGLQQAAVNWIPNDAGVVGLVHSVVEK